MKVDVGALGKTPMENAVPPVRVVLTQIAKTERNASISLLFALMELLNNLLVTFDS